MFGANMRWSIVVQFVLKIVQHISAEMLLLITERKLKIH